MLNSQKVKASGMCLLCAGMPTVEPPQMVAVLPPASNTGNGTTPH